MFGLSPMKILLLLLIVVILFGAKRIPRLAGDLGKGFRSFGKAVRGEDEDKDKSSDDKSGDDRP
ncbi:MAG: twin-arginine translocase TatA/TatE family subunit [Deltaproteobacteria bacterium]|nr:twin-arginine translocase TatA/TatE family subunit [Deltaproteobacteria bacterium]